MTKKVTKRPFDLRAALAEVFDLRYFSPDEALGGRTAIPYTWTPSGSRLILVLGENASGKSFFRRLLRWVTHRGSQDNKAGPHPIAEFIHLSMESRAGSMMEGFAKMVVYGDEHHDSTGCLTAATVSNAISTANGRDHDVLLYWDEPDIGMSARAAAGVGVAIREWVESLPEHVRAVVVTTHSPHLVAEVAGVRPQFIYLGDSEGPRTVEEWLAAQAGPTVPIRPEALREAGRARFQDIRAILGKRA